MVGITDAVRSATRPRDWKDCVSAIRHQLGTGAASYIADQVGVHPDTARRWIATAAGRGGGQRPNQHVAGRIAALESAAEEGWVIADALAHASILHCGHVKVFYNGKSQGFRKVGSISVSAEMQQLLQETGDLYAIGDTDGAEQILSDAILGEYSQQRARDSRSITAGTLTIGDFQGGFSLS
jgi:hypothetical protein